ncbi:MAG: hypothetical protein OEW64_00665 [Gammaproteobacteria bacterium]|nr:hypothetical protein [Gammaproteobacteria bacterium]MDH5302591.1 hypothetical protein [Gammaproteobacteria bacterium]MDH5321070.1 hypothetical protein [Gammaproteobacteria bacterium]
MSLVRKFGFGLRLLVLPMALVALPGTSYAVPLAVGACEDFESGLANWTIGPGTGFAGISAATSASPSNSLFVNGGTVTASSNVIDTTDVWFSDLVMWIQRGSNAFSDRPDQDEDLVVEYLDNVGAWVALEVFSGNGQPGQVFARNYLLPAAGRHASMRLRFRMTGGDGFGQDFWHVDDICLVQIPSPSLLVSKIAETASDPVNGSANPRAIPQALVRYTIAVTNEGNGSPAAGSIIITDPVPAQSALFVGTTSGDPVIFVDGIVPSGLSYSYAADVTFSNQPGGGTPYNYIPVPDGQGYDPMVTGYRIQPSGTMNPAIGSSFPSFSIQLLVRIQ